MEGGSSKAHEYQELRVTSGKEIQMEEKRSHKKQGSGRNNRKKDGERRGTKWRYSGSPHSKDV